VKFSQRRRTRKKTTPYSRPHPNATRGGVRRATISSGVTTSQGVSDQSVRGKASASRNPATARIAA
jgi:hypothetical protein